MTTTKTTKSEVQRLREELADIKAGRVFHLHVPRDGSESFRCWSPYCDDLGANAPAGAPDGRDDVERYRR